MEVWPDVHPNSMLSGQKGILVKSTHMVHLFCLRGLLNCMTKIVMLI